METNESQQAPQAVPENLPPAIPTPPESLVVTPPANPQSATEIKPDPAPPVVEEKRERKDVKWSREDYRKQDWENKTDEQIAADMGVSVAYIRMQRGRFRNEKERNKFRENRPATPQGQAAEPPPPDFSDIGGAAGNGEQARTEPPPLVETLTDYNEMAGFLFDATTGSLANVFGPEWLARADAEGGKTSKERDGMILAIARYLKSKEVKDVPPGVMLTICCLAYAGPRLRQPSTASKISAGWTWFKSKFGKKKKQMELSLVK